jgi:voltage-gated potassium channel
VRMMLRRAATVLFWLSGVTVLGTVGYRTIEGWSWIDSLYMAVITLSTVGFGEIESLSPAGRVFTVVFIGVGVGASLYCLALLAELVVEGRIKDTVRKELMMRRIERKQDHVIVAGFGRFGRAVVDELERAERKVVIVDPDDSLNDELAERGLAVVVASASSDEALLKAGIKGASAIVAATPSEAENVFITLGARELNPDIFIHARCESDSGARRLRRAGADHLSAPFQMGGARAAASILRPSVVDFLEIVSPRRGPEIDLEEIRVARGSSLDGKSVAELEGNQERFRIVAVKHKDEEIVIVPNPATPIAEDDVLIAIGERNSLMAFAAHAEGDASTARDTAVEDD